MELNITGRHLELTEEIKDFTRKKMDKLAYYDHLITNIEIILARDSKQLFAEGKINLKGSFVLAQAGANDIYLAIGQLANKLIRQVKHHDGKLKSKKRLARSRSGK